MAQRSSVTRLLAEETQKQQENVETYVGTASPYNFNGLVRHYYLRRGPNVADIQVNILPKGERNLQSHEIAKRVRMRLEPIAQRYAARIKVAEVPPGPPVTLVAEVYGPSLEGRITLARRVRDLFKQTNGIVDVDWYVEDDQPFYRMVVDQEKAALNGISNDDIESDASRLRRLCSRIAPSGSGKGRRSTQGTPGPFRAFRYRSHPDHQGRAAVAWSPSASWLASKT